MIEIRPAQDRGHFDHGWLETWHSFSFAEYFDPEHMGFRVLRVINQDRVQPGQGFGTHPHRDMEILTYVLEGALEHRDSMGNGSIIHAGEVQRMTAGTGVTHSEYNPSNSDVLHLLQIWILPEKKGLKPGYEQRKFDEKDKLGQLRLIASRNAREGSLRIHQDVDVHAGVLGTGQELVITNAPARSLWVQVASGAVEVGERRLAAGDGAAVTDPGALRIRGVQARSELLVFDLP